MKKIIAFDLASSEIRSILAEVSENETVHVIVAEKIPSEGIRHGVIHNPTGTAFTISVSIKRLNNSIKQAEHQKNFFSAFGGRGFHIIRRNEYQSFIKTTSITAKTIDEMAEACCKANEQEKEKVYDIIPVMYEVDGKPTECPEEKKGKEIKATYHLLVGNSDIKLNFEKCVERMGVNQAQPPCMAVEAFSIVVTNQEERKKGCAIINLGESTTTLAVYKNELLNDVMVVPLGGGNISRDIEYCGINADYAEKLKQGWGVALESLVTKQKKIKIPAKDPQNDPVILSNLFLAQIIEARLDEMFAPIFMTLKRYASDASFQIVLTGGGSYQTGILEYVQLKTGITTRLGDHSQWLSKETSPEFQHRAYTQIIGTIVIASRTLKPQETNKPVKPQHRSKIAQIKAGMGEFFSDKT